MDWGAQADGGDFPVPPKPTVARNEGGAGFSVVPDTCRVGIDVRLTEAFDAGAAEKPLHEAAANLDAGWPDTRPSTVEVPTSQPGGNSHSVRNSGPITAASAVAAVLREHRRRNPWILDHVWLRPAATEHPLAAAAIHLLIA